MNRRSFIGKAAALPAALTLAHAASPSGPVFYVEVKAYKTWRCLDSAWEPVTRESSRAYCFNADDHTYRKWSVSGCHVGMSVKELRGSILAKYPNAVFKDRYDEPEEYAGLEWRLTELVEHWNHGL